MLRSFSAIIPVALLFTGCGQKPPVQAKEDTGPIAVRVAPVKVRDVRRIIESVGTLFPFDEAIISAEIEGRVERVGADLGDHVSEGQVLVNISDEEQRYLLAQNEAQLRQSLERLGLKNDKDRVNDIRETPEVRRAQAELNEAEMRYKRTDTLVEQKIGAPADLDQARARFEAAQAAYDAMLNQTRNLIQEVERFKAQVELQRKKLRDTTVRAPFTAQVKERQVTVGQYVNANTPLFTLVNIDPIRLRIEVPERMAPWIKNGQIAQVALEAFTDRKFQGKIWRISPTVDQSKRTFIVEALIPNPGNALKPGSYAKAIIPTDKSDRVKVIPVRAVNYVFGSNKAYVVSGDTVDARDVKVGDRFEQEIEILEGLEDGEQVATTQVNRLDTGTKVTIQTGAEPPARSSE
jgi:RND family efflux transporter MFP subunit